MNNDKFLGKISQTPICKNIVNTNQSKKIFIFLFSVILLLAAVSAVDAALCRGFDGYYHDCGYNYGINSYGSSYGSGHGSSSYGKHSYGHYRNEKVVYLNNYKKHNPINDYYIYSGPGYQRTYKDANVKYVSYKHKTPKKKVVYVEHYEPEVRKVRYISDGRHYEPRQNNKNSGRQLSIKLVGNDYGHKEVRHTSSCGVVRNEHHDPHSHNCGGEVIRLGSNSDDSIWHDGNPYHYVNNHDHNIKTWKLDGKNSCPDGFACASGSYY